MPPRVREVAARLNAMGFLLERRGKGDHSIYRHPVTHEIIVLERWAEPRGAQARMAQVTEALRLEEEMKTITVRIDFDADAKTYGATSEELPDVYAVSDDRDDVLRRFVFSANAYLAYLRDQGQPLPSSLDSHAELVTVAIEAA